MGQDISKSITPPPLTLHHCFVDGKIDIPRYLYYRRKLDDQIELSQSISNRLNTKRKFDEGQSPIVQCRKKRSVKRHKLLVRDDDDSLRELTPKDTLWYLLYVHTPPRNDRLRRQFRLRFRMPYDTFVSMCGDLTNHEMFDIYNKYDAVGDKASDIRLLLLGVLRYIGRAWTLDDVEEANGISRETNRRFLSLFLEYGSTILYRKWVIDPSLNKKISDQEKLFRLAGFNGCIGSSDATHVGMLSCAAWAQVLNKGYKLNMPSRTYNITVDHSRLIHGSTLGHPATWNDKTLILYDELVCGVNNGNIPDDFEFMLYERNEKGEVVEVAYKGVWFMVDNGYLNWSCTVPPVKDGTSYEVIRFSEWLESMRKDVECAFGILKGRFAILRYGIRLRSIAKCDKVWLTCCALHNMLLHIDGLNKNWGNGVPSDWEIINETNKGSPKHLSVPFAITRLNRQFTEKLNTELKLSDSIAYEDEGNRIINYNRYTVNGKRVVSKMPLSVFQNCLVENFDIRYKQNDIIWPRHIKQPQVI